MIKCHCINHVGSNNDEKMMIEYYLMKATTSHLFIIQVDSGNN